MESLKDKITIGMNTDLEEFGNLIHEERMIKKGKGIIDRASLSVVAMLGYLSREHYPGSLVPRQIKNVGELYSFTGYEIRYKFSKYGKKTWQKLNKHLMDRELPPLKLPPKYIDPQ